jgi:hypothetical protein
VKPSIGRIVHYVSYGTPGGEYRSECRAAVVTAVWPGGTAVPAAVSVAVLNPTGMFFNEEIRQDEGDHRGGTWHWPERTEG